MAKTKKKTTKKNDSAATYYVAKWALTQGIVETSGRVSGSGEALACAPAFLGREVQVLRPDWSEDETQARARAAELQAETLATLDAQITILADERARAEQGAADHKIGAAATKRLLAPMDARYDRLVARKQEIAALQF